MLGRHKRNILPTAAGRKGTSVEILHFSASTGETTTPIFLTCEKVMRVATAKFRVTKEVPTH